MKILLKSQQGKLDAVLMYNALARAAKEQKEKETFLQLAKEEGRHASVFHKLTHTDITPKHTKEILLPLLNYHPLLYFYQFILHRTEPQLCCIFNRIMTVALFKNIGQSFTSFHSVNQISAGLV